MKETTSSQEKPKRSAEEWVTIARNFGEECVKIQQDPKLNIDQKLEKQRSLGAKMTKDIQEDSYLTEEDKRQMINSINNYMDEWQTMHDVFKEGKRQDNS